MIGRCSGLSRAVVVTEHEGGLLSKYFTILLLLLNYSTPFSTNGEHKSDVPSPLEMMPYF